MICEQEPKSFVQASDASGSDERGADWQISAIKTSKAAVQLAEQAPSFTALVIILHQIVSVQWDRTGPNLVLQICLIGQAGLVGYVFALAANLHESFRLHSLSARRVNMP